MVTLTSSGQKINTEYFRFSELRRKSPNFNSCVLFCLSKDKIVLPDQKMKQNTPKKIDRKWVGNLSIWPADRSYMSWHPDTISFYYVIGFTVKHGFVILKTKKDATVKMLFESKFWIVNFSDFLLYFLVLFYSLIEKTRILIRCFAPISHDCWLVIKR